MRHRVSRISVHQSALMLAVLYGGLGLVFIPFFLVLSVLDPTDSTPMLLMLLFPVLYAAMGYVISAISFLIYNLVAGAIGGIEFTLTPVDAVDRGFAS